MSDYWNKIKELKIDFLNNFIFIIKDYSNGNKNINVSRAD